MMNSTMRARWQGWLQRQDRRRWQDRRSRLERLPREDWGPSETLYQISFPPPLCGSHTHSLSV